MARLRTSGANGAVTNNPDRLLEDLSGKLDQANVFMPLTEIGNELIVAEPEAGLYRARGVQWAPGTPVSLVQILGNTQTDLLIQNSAAYDQRTGVISFDTRLGGKVYMDPSVGTVRFSSAVPSRNAKMYLTYTPRFLRISEGGAAGYNDPTGLYDSRLISDPTYWRAADGTQADYSTTSNGSLLSNDRMIFTYNRAAAGTGQAARPFIQTMRFGVNLPYRLPTQDNGAVGAVLRNGSTVNPILGISFADGRPNDAFQIDPARTAAMGTFNTNGQIGNQGQGAIYFPASSEGRVVTITHYGVDENGRIIYPDATSNTPSVFTTTARISLIPERTEAPLPIQTAVNESGLVSFLDPFTYASERRPPMVWLMWASTRNGSPDLYFETVSPNWSPITVTRFSQGGKP
jgi:hypothetical protein